MTRPKGIYSFSHLTFHEYFAARKIVMSANSDVSLQKFATYSTEKRWREILLLICGMLENADLLLEAMKESIDKSINQDKKLQDFLVWVEQKSCFLESDYNSAAVRAHYLNLGILLSLNLPFVESCSLTHLLDSNFPILSNTNLSLNDDLNHSLKKTPRGEFITRSSTGVSFYQTPKFDSNSRCNYNHDQELDFATNLNLVINLDLTLTHTVKSMALQTLLQNSKEQLPDIYSMNFLAVYRWWDEYGKAWINQLRKIAIEHLNIGHDWQFSEDQKKLLQQYYDANKLLIECLNSDCYVSREVRESIESTLLLPISSIEKLKSS
jgi:predicted NACHT family NTPase